jgi:hypothetical protein
MDQVSREVIANIFANDLDAFVEPSALTIDPEFMGGSAVLDEMNSPEMPTQFDAARFLRFRHSCRNRPSQQIITSYLDRDSCSI